MSLPTYTTENGVTVTEGDTVYDYYSMEPVLIGEPCGADPSQGWFHTYRPQDAPVWDYRKSTWANNAIGAQVGVYSSAGMLNGQRICTLEYARRRGFPGA